MTLATRLQRLSCWAGGLVIAFALLTLLFAGLRPRTALAGHVGPNVSLGVVSDTSYTDIVTFTVRSFAPQTHTVPTNGGRTRLSLMPGDYELDVVPFQGWRAAGISCTPGGSCGYDPATGVTTFTVGYGPDLLELQWRLEPVGYLRFIYVQSPFSWIHTPYTVTVDGGHDYTEVLTSNLYFTFTWPVGSYTMTQQNLPHSDTWTAYCETPSNPMGYGMFAIDVLHGTTTGCGLIVPLDAGVVRIVTRTDPPAATPTISYSMRSTTYTTWASPTFQMTGTATRTFDVPAGLWTVELETVPDGWEVDYIDCVSEGAISYTGQGVSMDILDDHMTQCTFKLIRTLAPDLFVSMAGAGKTGGGLAYGSSDILRYDGESWTKWFDGAAHGLSPSGLYRNNINAFWIPNAEQPEFYFSLAQTSGRLPGIVGAVESTDIIRWTGEGFERIFRGRDLGLNLKTAEKIDALQWLEQSPVGSHFKQCPAGYLMISTRGRGAVPLPTGGSLRFTGSDILGFCAFSLGSPALGQWELAASGADFGLATNALIGLSVGPTDRIWMLLDRPLLLRNVVQEARPGQTPPLVSVGPLPFDGFSGNRYADGFQDAGYFELLTQ